MLQSRPWAAIVWMCQNQIGRRNISDEQKTYLLGKLYEARKNTVGAADGFRGNQYSKVVSTQIGNMAKDDPIRVSEQIAKERGIAKNSVIRANQFAHGLDAADAVAPGFKEKVLTGAKPCTQIGNMVKPHTQTKQCRPQSQRQCERLRYTIYLFIDFSIFTVKFFAPFISAYIAVIWNINIANKLAVILFVPFALNGNIYLCLH